jgi:hypothetical protein
MVPDKRRADFLLLFLLRKRRAHHLAQVALARRRPLHLSAYFLKFNDVNCLFSLCPQVGNNISKALRSLRWLGHPPAMSTPIGLDVGQQPPISLLGGTSAVQRAHGIKQLAGLRKPA